MWRIPININKKLLPIKMHYFLYTGSSATILSFATTYAKQLGYSKVTVAYMMMCLFILSMLTKPLSGAIVDKFRVKKYMFMAFILSTGVAAFFLMYAPELYLENSTILDCNVTKTVIRMYYNDDKEVINKDQTTLMVDNGQRFIDCKLNCINNELLFSEMSTLQNRSKKNISNVGHVDIRNVNDSTVSVHLYNQQSKVQVDNYDFDVKYVDANDVRLISPSCRHPVKMPCQLKCPYQQLVDLVSMPSSQRFILSMPEFWEFFLLACVFWISNSAIWSIQDPICYNLLGEKHHNFGKQRLWTSIGWGSVSMLSGWLVDCFSHDDAHKNYTPISYLILTFTVLNLIFASNITITEFKVSKNTCKNVFDMFTKSYVISFFLWIMLLGICNSMTMGYLFWYLEELASKHESRNHLLWIKTLQGLSQGFQTFLGEIPMYFYSGQLITKIGHKHCMSLVLTTLTARFFSYSILTNPVWVLLIETFNGMSYALGRAVMVSYSRLISPPSTDHTVLGLVGLFDSIGFALGTPLAGHLYDMFGGESFFRLYTCGAAIMCTLQITYSWVSSR